MMRKDITSEVKFDSNDGDSLPLRKCACGATFDSWDFILHEGNDFRDPTECPKCGRKMIFEANIRVYEVMEGGES